MKKKIYIAPAWGKFRNDRQGVIVELEDSKGNVFKYMPTYPDIDEINRLLNIVEIENKNKVKIKD
jgi:hypothetical protein